MKQILFLFLFSLASIKGDAYPIPEGKPQVFIQNAVVAKVMGKPITVLDIAKRMDLLLRTHYPEYVDSPEAKFHFYKASWRKILDEMINTELMIMDAQDKEMKLSDGEVREEMEKRYGPNVSMKLHDLEMSYEEAFELVKNEMIVQRISWYYVHGKAYQNVTPSQIREAYKEYCIKNPPKEEWTYQIITLDSPQQEISPEEFVQYCQMEDISADQLLSSTALTEKFEADIKVSDTYTVDFKDLSDRYKQILSELSEGEYSKPLPSRNGNGWKVFYLQNKNVEETPTLDTLYQDLSNQLLEEHVVQYSQAYIQKLRKHYHYKDQEFLQHFEPFSIQ